VITLSNYINNLDSAIIKLRSKCKKDASKKLLPQEKEALIVSIGMVAIPVIMAGITLLMN
jgi:hypothetical protein